MNPAVASSPGAGLLFLYGRRGAQNRCFPYENKSPPNVKYE
jgi:hypothetical protein